MLEVLIGKQLSPCSPAFTLHHIQVLVEGKYKKRCQQKSKVHSSRQMFSITANSPFAVHVLCVMFLDFCPYVPEIFKPLCLMEEQWIWVFQKGHKGENPASWKHKSSCYPAPSKHTLMLAAPPCPARDQGTTLPDAVQTHFPYISYEWRSPV